MATEVAVAPTLGHAVLYTQGGVGATPGYDAIDLRRSIEAATALQEGVLNSTGWKVRERAAGANMTVEVDANVGLAIVQGDSVTHQSRYVVAPHSAVVTLDIAAAHSTNPRVDMVVLQVRDNTHDALGQNDARVMVLTGTPTAGATIDNLNGQVSLPSNALRLADIHVPAADTTIANAQIRDRRRWARGALFVGTRTSGDVAISGANWQEVDGTNLKARIECSGAPVRVAFFASGFSSAPGSAAFAYSLDGDLIGAASLHARNRFLTHGATSNYTLASSWGFVPTAGSHLLSLIERALSGTLTLYGGGGSGGSIDFHVEEIVRPNATNS
jgi:hypothetical protein